MNQDLFDKHYKETRSKISGLILFFCKGDMNRANEVMVATYTKFYQSDHSGDGAIKYLTRIAKNEYFNSLRSDRSNRVDNTISLDEIWNEPGNNDSIEENIDRQNVLEMISQILDECPEKIQKIVELRAQELEVREISRLLSIPEGSIKSILFRLREKILGQIPSEYHSYLMS